MRVVDMQLQSPGQSPWRALARIQSFLPLFKLVDGENEGVRHNQLSSLANAVERISTELLKSMDSVNAMNERVKDMWMSKMEQIASEIFAGHIQREIGGAYSYKQITQEVVKRSALKTFEEIKLGMTLTNVANYEVMSDRVAQEINFAMVDVRMALTIDRHVKAAATGYFDTKATTKGILKQINEDASNLGWTIGTVEAPGSDSAAKLLLLDYYVEMVKQGHTDPAAISKSVMSKIQFALAPEFDEPANAEQNTFEEQELAL